MRFSITTFIVGTKMLLNTKICDSNLYDLYCYDDQENLLQIVCYLIVFGASKILHEFGWTCAFYWPYGTKVELLLAKFVARAPC